MKTVSLYSAPFEFYLEHIFRCKEKFDNIFSIFENTIERVLEAKNLREIFYKMIVFHDLGKLTEKWQKNIRENKSLPSHATLGAAYLWKILPDGLREPLSFAVAIHHTDKGLLADNIEKPDVQAILDGIVDFSGNIIWDEEAFKLENDFFPEEVKNLTIYDLKDMAKGLRVWAKGCGLIEQHKGRLQATLVHHILKLCDISASIERKEYQECKKQDYYGGWLMVENIKNYVESIIRRVKV